MAEIEAAIHTRLTGFAGLSALVAARVYPMHLQQPPTLPALTYQRIGGRREGALGVDVAVYQRMQIDIWAETYAAAKAVAKQVRLALQRWSDNAADPRVLDCTLERDTDLPVDLTAINSGSGEFRVSQDYVVLYEEDMS